MSATAAAALLDSADEVTVIGDVHGQGGALFNLLEVLGWKRTNLGWRGPKGARLLFVGDLIDRGTQNGRVVKTVRELVEGGHALCLMGNHEYNAVLYHTPDPLNPGEYLRPRGRGHEKNTVQHQAVLEEFKERPAELEDMVQWFRGLPLAIEHQGFRAVHACWPSPEQLAHLRASGGAWFIGDDQWTRICRREAPGYDTIQTVLKGPERSLPGGAHFLDKDGHRRTKARVRWWKSEPRTLGQALDLPQGTFGIDPSAKFLGSHEGYPASERPVFFGHYWKGGPTVPDSDNAACLDYSAGMGDRLVAYRFGGERKLFRENFTSVAVPTPAAELAS